MTKCVDCSCEFEGHDSQCIRCANCQKEFRKNKNKNWNKSTGTARRTAELYKWANEIMKLTSDDLMQLVTVYKKRIKYANTDEDKKELRTKLKIITVRYNKLQPTRGALKNNVYGKYSICEDCRFFNKKQLQCTQHDEDEMDKAIESGVCDDYEYDSESKFRKEYYKQDVERNDELDDLGDYEYNQYEDSDE